MGPDEKQDRERTGPLLLGISSPSGSHRSVSGGWSVPILVLQDVALAQCTYEAQANVWHRVENRSSGRAAAQGGDEEDIDVRLWVQHVPVRATAGMRARTLC